MTFKTEIKIHFDEADPAGIAFSATLFTKIHRCYEEFVEALGQDPEQFFLGSELIFPLRHMEAEYFGPLFPLKKYRVEIGTLKISESSFQLQYSIKDQGKTLCQLRSTHVSVLKSKMEKVSLPIDLKENLEKFGIPQ